MSAPSSIPLPPGLDWAVILHFRSGLLRYHRRCPHLRSSSADRRRLLIRRGHPRTRSRSTPMSVTNTRTLRTLVRAKARRGAQGLHSATLTVQNCTGGLTVTKVVNWNGVTPMARPSCLPGRPGALEHQHLPHLPAGRRHLPLHRPPARELYRQRSAARELEYGPSCRPYHCECRAAERNRRGRHEHPHPSPHRLEVRHHHLDARYRLDASEDRQRLGPQPGLRPASSR